MDDKYKVKVKICLLGDAGVGKTSLIRRYVMDMFDDKYITTLGTKVSKRKLVIKKNDNEFDLTFSIWDILGQEEFKNIQNMALKNSKGAIIVCDITRKKTLENIPFLRGSGPACIHARMRGCHCGQTACGVSASF